MLVRVPRLSAANGSELDHLRVVVDLVGFGVATSLVVPAALSKRAARCLIPPASNSSPSIATRRAMAATGALFLSYEPEFALRVWSTML